MIGVGPHGGGGGGGGASLEYNFVAGENINQYEVVYGDTAGGVGRVKKAINAADKLNKFHKAEKATVEEQDAAKEQKKPVKKPVQKSESTMELPAQLRK